MMTEITSSYMIEHLFFTEELHYQKEGQSLHFQPHDGCGTEVSTGPIMGKAQRAPSFQSKEKCRH